jgi:hypothetical protein
MSKKAGFILCVAAFLALFVARPGSAQQIIFNFVQPANVDPPTVLTFTGITPVFSNGMALLPMLPDTNGVELHAAIPGIMGGDVDVTQIKISFTYTGTVVLNSQGTSPYAPWSAMDAVTGSTHTLTLTALPGFPSTGSAPINNNLNPDFGNQFHQSFAGIAVTGATADVQLFTTQNNTNTSVVYTPTLFGQERVVPEPGALALLGGLGIGSGLIILRRRRTGR